MCFFPMHYGLVGLLLDLVEASFDYDEKHKKMKVAIKCLLRAILCF